MAAEIIEIKSVSLSPNPVQTGGKVKISVGLEANESDVNCFYCIFSSELETSQVTTTATVQLRKETYFDDEYISRNEHNAFASDVDHEQTRQNKRIEALEVTVRQINDLTLSVQKLAINMEHMLVNQTEQSKRLEELENRDGEKWRSISMYVLTAVVGAVIGFVLKQAGL